MATWQFVFILAVAGTGVLATPSITHFHNIIDSRANSRIVSGWEADQGQFPHQLSLRIVSNSGGVFSCGGSIISPEWGLTAAHCSANYRTLVIRAGHVNVSTPLYIFETNKYHNHPQYVAWLPFVQQNDIALIEFGLSLSFGDYIKPIRLQRSSDKDRNYDGQVAVASGWGLTWTNGASPEHLNWVYLRAVSNEACLWAYQQSSVVVDSTICARYYNVTSQSTCQGDSGGPLTVIDDDGLISLVGVTSFGSREGCHVGLPAGFIRPGHYHNWFTQVTGIDFDWEYEQEEMRG